MLSQSQVNVVSAGESVALECRFTANQYNMFDYPLLWRKVRHVTVINVIITNFSIIIVQAIICRSSHLYRVPDRQVICKVRLAYISA